MPDPGTLTADLPRALAARRPTVVVVGDAILDGWVSGVCTRLSREAPVPVLDVGHRHCAPGGAANTAANLAALGAHAVLVAAVGDDADGALLRDQLRSAGVDVSGTVVVPDRSTATKRRLVADGQLLARVDEIDDRPLPESAVDGLRAALTATEPDAVLVCDYGLGLADTLADALRSMRPSVGLFAVDAHDVPRWADLRPDIVTPNAEEAAAALGGPLPDDPRQRQADLHRATGADCVVVTMDTRGSVLLARDRPAHRTWATPVPDRQATGAGDTFTAAVCLARACGVPTTTAVELGQAAADVVVHDGGTSVCTTELLAERLGQFRTAALRPEQLADRVAAHRLAGRRIVLTNGCFDVLHSGHVAYLNQAKQLGDVLIVGLNSDAGVRRLKGPGRPVNGESDRAAVVAALSCVDHVAVFDEDDATGLVELVRPDSYVKGGDYTPQMLPETPVVRRCGGEVRILDYLPERSTTAVIDRIRATA
ncbi:MAG TPA: D-glycero-beta-D-manno-heptose 1-phosphate adenylyltransferase [Pseudonocardiaceae bacterium]|nr:D-glycero-beta-D-manno-heptose 1-phosphate adenylyltransferase [Pseudonocardiaceae bacterium]